MSNRKDHYEHRNKVQENESNFPLSKEYPEQNNLRWLDQKIRAAKSSEEIAFLIQVRRELINQNQQEVKLNLELVDKKRKFWGKKVAFASFLVLGTIFIFTGFSLVGFFVVGGAITMEVPEYVKDFLKTFKN